jgi:hypothetical protein
MESREMKKILNDDEAIAIIKFLYEGGPDTEEEWSLQWDFLENYQLGIAEIMLESKEKLAPEEILRLAREKNKPILL